MKLKSVKKLLLSRVFEPKEILNSKINKNQKKIEFTFPKTTEYIKNNNNKLYFMIYGFFLVFLFFILVYLFFLDNIYSPIEQISFINETISNAVKNGYREEIVSYIEGITSTDNYKSAWISCINNKNKYGKSYNENDYLYDFKKYNFSLARIGNEFYIVVNESLLEEYLPKKLDYKFHLSNKIYFMKYILIFLFSNIVFLFFLIIYYYLNSKKNYILAKMNVELQHKAKFSEYTAMLAHDTNKIVNLLLRMRKSINEEKDIKKRELKMNLFSDEIQSVSNKVSSTLNNMNYLNEECKIDRNEVNFYSDLLLPVINKYENKFLFKYKSDTNYIIKIDKVLFERILINIISNAVEAVEDGVEFEIIFELNSFKEYNEIVIRNTESFILEEDLENIFEMYVSKRKANGVLGSGLGLPSVRKFVEAHSGKIKCFSSEIEKYVEYRITIPIL